jgi:hypothetical protein
LQEVVGDYADRTDEDMELDPPRKQGIVETQEHGQGKAGHREHDCGDAKDLFAGSIRRKMP